MVLARSIHRRRRWLPLRRPPPHPWLPRNRSKYSQAHGPRSVGVRASIASLWEDIMRWLTLSCFLAIMLCIGGTCPGTAGEKMGFIGPDLSAWEGLMEYWTFKDGTLTGATPKGLKFNTFLCSKKQYRDFELKFQVRLTGGGANSGVQVRSKIRDNPKDKAVFAVEGPQCDMGGQYWGSLYGEHFGGMMQAA